MVRKTCLLTFGRNTTWKEESLRKRRTSLWLTKHVKSSNSNHAHFVQQPTHTKEHMHMRSLPFYSSPHSGRKSSRYPQGPWKKKSEWTKWAGWGWEKVSVAVAMMELCDCSYSTELNTSSKPELSCWSEANSWTGLLGDAGPEDLCSPGTELDVWRWVSRYYFILYTWGTSSLWGQITFCGYTSKWWAAA